MRKKYVYVVMDYDVLRGIFKSFKKANKFSKEHGWGYPSKEELR